jgi:hypothetical protein
MPDVRWPRGLHPSSGSWPGLLGFRQYQIPRPPVGAYQRVVRVPITGLAGSAIVAGGTATVQLGPSGLGNRWYLTQCNVTTSTGATDTSTVALFMGNAPSVASLLGGTSYAGGQDTIGLNIRPLERGDLLIAVWSGAHNGDTATLIVYGAQDALA